MCEPKAAGLSAGAVVAAAAAVLAVEGILSAAQAIGVTVLSACAVTVVVAWWMERRTRLPVAVHKPLQMSLRQARQLAATEVQLRALPAPPLAIEGTIVGKEEPWRATVSATALMRGRT